MSQFPHNDRENGEAISEDRLEEGILDLRAVLIPVDRVGTFYERLGPERRNKRRIQPDRSQRRGNGIRFRQNNLIVQPRPVGRRQQKDPTERTVPHPPVRKRRTGSAVHITGMGNNEDIAVVTSRASGSFRIRSGKIFFQLRTQFSRVRRIPGAGNG